VAEAKEQRAFTPQRGALLVLLKLFQEQGRRWFAKIRRLIVHTLRRAP
jgi:hypothetical protein